MDLSGNLWDLCITVGNSTGRAFVGSKHGDGSLTASGNHSVSSWPDTSAVGTGYRGGNWLSGLDDDLRISWRGRAAVTRTNRGTYYGGRGVRTAP